VTSHRRPIALFLAGLALAFAGVGTLGSATGWASPATRPPVTSPTTSPPPPAAPSPTTTPPPPSHPDADSLGSTIRAHEPVDNVAAASTQANATTTGQPQGMDVASYQGNVDWATAAGNGAQFAYVKATEASGTAAYRNPYFAQQYNGSANAGLIRGAYHFAVPNQSSGTEQANFFVDNGGGWSADGRTLPPMLDIEYNPYAGNTCYDLSPSAMVAWIQDFSTTVNARTGRYPTIYSTRGWWDQCTGSNASFGSTNPLFIACYCASPGTMPAGWAYQSIWQYSDAGTFPGDQDLFNGTSTQLATFAAGGPGGFVATGPTRVLDTRSGVGAPAAQVGPGGTVTLTVPNLPAGTTGVVLNLTATGLNGVDATYISACPAAQALSTCVQTSALNPNRGVTIANELTVPVAPDGKVLLYNSGGSIDLVADLAGYLTGGFVATGPTRVLDTRSGVGAPAAQVGPGGTVTLTVPNLPAGTTGVVLNLTATGLNGVDATYISACPAAQALSTCVQTSALNPNRGVTIANELTVPVAPDGKVLLYNSGGSIDLVADLAGSYTSQ